MRANFVLIDECPLLLAPLDSDLLTMSAPLAYRDSVLYGDKTYLFHAAQAIMQLQVWVLCCEVRPCLTVGPL